MAKNEAKIKFTAETGEFNSDIKKSNSEMGKLRAELKLNETQMKATGETVEGLEKQHELLEGQLKASQTKVEALSGKVEAAARIFGENSDEVIKLKTQLANAQTAEEKLRQAVSECSDKLDQQRKTADKTESATENLTNKIEEQQSEVKRLKSEYADVVLQQGKNSKEAKELAKQIDSLSDELDKNERELKEAERAADKFDNTLDDAGDSAEGFNGKMAAVAAGVAAAGAALVEFGKSSIEAFNEVDEGADNIVKATGATGEQAAELEEVYKNVASSVVGDFADIGSAIGEINTRFSFTGSELETAATKFQKFSEITGVDATEAVQAVSRALNDAGIPLDEYDTLLDQLAKAGQAAGIDVTTLADSLSTNGSIMRSMGFDTEETIALLSNFEVAGADTSTMLTGMKKAMATWADAGKDGGVEFGKMVAGIKDGSISAADAIDVFGTKAGPMLVDAIKSGKFEYQDMLSVIQNSEGAVENTFAGTVDGGYELELAMQNCKLAMAEVGGVVGEALTPVFQALSTTVIPAVVDGFGAVVEGVKSAVQWMKEHKAVVIAIASVIGILTTAITAYNVVQGIKAAMEAANVTTVWALVAAHLAQAAAAIAAVAPYILIVAAIAAVIAIIVVCVKYWDEIVAAVKKAWEAIKQTLAKWGEWINTNVIQPVKEFFSGLWDGIKETAVTVWDAIKAFFAAIPEWFNTNIIQPIVNFFTGLWQGIVNIWNTISNAIQVAIMFIGSILKAAFDIITLPFRLIWENCKEYVFAAWDWIKNAISTAINAVKNVITTVMNAIRNVFTTVWNAIKNVFTTVWNAIKAFITPIINAIKNAITTAWNNIKSVTSTVFNAIKSVISTIWNAIKSAVTTAVNAVKSVVTNVWNAIKSTASSVWNGIKSVISNVWNNIKSSVSNAVNGVKNTVSNVFNGIKNVATNVWNGIKNAIMNPIEAAKQKVKNALDAIKGFFDKLKIKFPDIKLPHFKIEGKFSLSPPSVPKLKIDWYKDGGIMLKPTIFGMNGNRLMAGGEAGPEAIAPISKLQSYITSAVDRASNAFDVQSLVAAVEDLASRPIELFVGDRQIAVATASASDSVNGLRSSFKSRGLIVE